MILAMAWQRQKYRLIGHVGRVFAVLAVLMWSVDLSACPSGIDAKAEHEHVSADAGHSGTGRPTDGQPDSCCHSLVAADLVYSAPVSGPSIKAVVIPTIISSPSVSPEPVAAKDLEPAPSATDPPRRRKLRFTTYSPLAPPSRHI
ncbi:MAG: hypothetical protein HOP13_15425 [Alphaproteobacteria bacterium]|nr:hypothetical protein [Alphaproteobacteria bacterium]